MQDGHKKSYVGGARRYHEPQEFRLVWPLLVLAFLSLAQGSIAACQQPAAPRLGEAIQGPGTDMAVMDTRLAERQLQMLNIQRQKTMVSDADKLLKLATELKTELAASDSASLSAEQLRKISEIEKLARKVKQKMTFTLGVGPPIRDVFLP